MTFRFSEAADQRVLTAYQRLPGWQQHVLAPLPMSAYVLTMWPTPICIGLIAAFHAYLKIAYAPEVAFAPEWLSWSQLGWMATSPLWLPIAFGYPLLIWAGIGIIPYASIIYRRQRREGRPFVLHDPALNLAPELSVRLRQGSS